MNAQQMGRFLIASFLVGASGSVPAARAQSHFIESVPPQAAPVFENLTTFSSPSGTGTGRLTFIKLVTDAAVPVFQIQRVVGQTAQVEVGAPADADDVILEPPLSTPVASVIAVPAGSGFCPATPVAAGFQLVCVIVQYDDAYDFSDGAETWQLNVLEDASTEFEYFGWAGVVSTDLTAAESAVSLAQIEASSVLDFGGVQRSISSNEAPVLAPVVRNIGTAPLTITAGPISGDPSPAFFSMRVFAPTPLDPGALLVNDFQASQGIWAMASPTALGDRESTLTLESNGGAANVALRATGVTLFGHMLLDCSGSMGWRPDGGFTSEETETRLFQAKEAAKEVNNWIRDFSSGEAYFGLTTFPPCGGPNTRVPIDRSTNTHPSINFLFGPTTAGGLDATNSTPMEAGIEAAIADMDARINNEDLPPTASDRPNLRQAILMFSDGAENVGSNAASTIGSLQNKEIRMYNIGYGVPGSADVDHALLSELADETSGDFWDANSLDAFALRNAFKNAVRAWMDLEPIEDPTGTIRRGQVQTHTACVDPEAYGLTFVVDWDRAAAQGIELTLESPTGETITPTSSGVSFHGSETFAQYILRGDRIRGGGGAGEWTLRLEGGSSIPSNADTRYSYSVLAQTPIRVERRPVLDLATGAANLMEVQLAPSVRGYTEPVVTVQYDVPTASFGTYLATSDIDRSWFFAPAQADTVRPRSAGLFHWLARPLHAQQAVRDSVRVPDVIMGERASIGQRISWALANIADRPFVDERSSGTLQLYDDGTHGDRLANDGVYSALGPALMVDGIYRYAIQVLSAEGERRACVNRDIRVSDYVAVHLSPELIQQNVEWRTDVDASFFFDPEVARKLTGGEIPAGYTRTAAVFTPKDEFGNFWGPGRMRDISFRVANGEAIGAGDNWDGSYFVVIQHSQDAQPAVVINAAGVQSFPIELPQSSIPPRLLLLILLILLVFVAVRWLIGRRSQPQGGS